MSHTPILIAGPTASGKSALALHLAEEVGGALINADSMQIYRGLTVLTAAPDEAERARAPHFLYEALDPSERCSVGQWARMATDALGEIKSQDLTPIFVGGTGLYFRALIQGLASIPPIPEDVRTRADAAIAAEGAGWLLEDLSARDPETASKLQPTDRQRIQRAWEVLEATGQGLIAWQGEDDRPVLRGDVRQMVLAPPRDWIYERCNRRFDEMMDAGAPDEVRGLLARELDPSLPAMKALGVREIAAYLNGEMSLGESSEQAKMLTRRYAKRQMTWMRNQMGTWPRLDPSQDTFMEEAASHL